MAQHDYVIANQSGAAFRADLNNGLAAIVSLNSGATAPATTYAYMLWADTTAGLLKMRNGANSAWITLRELDGTLTIEDGTAASPGLAFASDLNTGIYSIGADSIGISTGGVNRLLANSSGQVAVTLAGSAGTPSFTKDDDLNTGLFYPAADNLAFTTGGSERSRFDSSGRLLVGATTSTTALANITPQLQVEGTTANAASASIFVNANDASSSAILFLGKSRGTTNGSATVVQADDRLGGIWFQGASGVNRNPGAASIEAFVDAAAGSGDMPGRLVFSTTLDGAGAPSERMRIRNDGNVLIGTTTNNANGGILQLSSGITFPATQVAATDASTLDDYEEGTFTPTIDGTGTVGTGTYSQQNGRYTKIGNRIHFHINLAWSAHTGTTNMVVGGLPFTPSNIANAVSIRHNNLTSPASTVVQGYVSVSTTTITLESVPVAGGAAAALALDTAATLTVAGSYQVA